VTDTEQLRDFADTLERLDEACDHDEVSYSIRGSDDTKHTVTLVYDASTGYRGPLQRLVHDLRRVQRNEDVVEAHPSIIDEEARLYVHVGDDSE